LAWRSWVRYWTSCGFREKGYELNKVEFEGQTCPSHLKMDVSLPDEPFLVRSDPLKERLASSLFWVKRHGHMFLVEV